MQCNVVRDLLPLYLDQLCEEETRQQIEEHLDGCEACRKRCEEMGSPLEEVVREAETDTVSIEPMKKIHNKIKRKNKLLVLVILLSVLVIGVLSYLSYGQITQTGQSFETVSQYIRFQYIGREFAKGNLEPLLSSLAIVGDDPEFAYYASHAYGDDENAYMQDAKEYIQNCYTEYFQGESLKLKKVRAEYHTNLVYGTRNLLVALIYEFDGIEYFIRLERNNGGKQYYAEDQFVVSTEPITYTLAEDDGETEESETEEELSSPWLDQTSALFSCLPSLDELNFFIAKRTVRNRYQECRGSGETLSPYVFITSLLYTTQECQQDRSRLPAYHDAMRERAEKIIQQNYWIRDIQFNPLSYDKEKHRFRYCVSLSLVNINNEEECELSIESYRNHSELVVIPGTEKLIGENIPEDARAEMMHLWTMPD